MSNACNMRMFKIKFQPFCVPVFLQKCTSSFGKTSFVLYHGCNENFILSHIWKQLKTVLSIYLRSFRVVKYSSIFFALFQVISTQKVSGFSFRLSGYWIIAPFLQITRVNLLCLNVIKERLGLSRFAERSFFLKSPPHI